MATNPETIPRYRKASRLKIYFLPNLLTAGNLFCGFVALTKIVEADPPDAYGYFGQITIRARLHFARVHF